MSSSLPPANASILDIPNQSLAGASMMWLLSIPGALLSIFLTVMKFRSDHRCDESLLSACQMGEIFDCGRVLHSPWSSPFGIPLSTYTASFYVVVFGLASCVLFRPTRFLAAARPLLLVLASVGAMAAALLAAYALFVVGSFCSQCTVLYAVNATLFLAAVLMNPAGLRAGLVALAHPVPRRASVTATALLSLVALTTVQAVLYLRAAVRLHIDEQCIVPGDSGRPLPATNLETPATPEIEAQVALFVDLSCPACKEEFHAWQKDIKNSGGRFQLSVYHYPRDSSCAPPGFIATDRGAERNRACRAAAAVECVERMAKGSGLDMMAALFALQGSSGPSFTDAALAGAAQTLGVPVDLDDPNHAFYRCLEGKGEYAAVLRTIREHMEFLQGRLTETPGALFVFYSDGVPLDRMVLVKGTKEYGDVEKFIRAARAEALGEATGARS